MTIQAFFEAVKIKEAKPPFDTLHLKIFYPAQLKENGSPQNFGVIPVDSTSAPFPVVIFFNGVNCEAKSYQWLMEKLAATGLVVVSFNWIAENIPGMIGLTPGVQLEKLKPDFYGTGATASALPALLKKLNELQQKGILAGQLDLEKVIIGGHSAGGRVAIESANPDFFPQIVASFAYGGHTLAGKSLGYEAKTILPLPDCLPLLLMGGTRDGVIANNTQFYGMTKKDPIYSVVNTFSQGIKGGRKDSYLVLLEGANHFCITHPLDKTTGTVLSDFSATESETEIRSLISKIIILFINAHVKNKPQEREELQQLLNNPNHLIYLSQNK
jgi:hypothetical protein